MSRDLSDEVNLNELKILNFSPAIIRNYIKQYDILYAMTFYKTI